MKAWRSSTVALPIVMLAAALLSACGGGPSTAPTSAVPTAPSPGVSQPMSTITGTVTTDTSGSVASASRYQTLGVTGLTITVVGTGLTSSVGSDGSFTIQAPSGTVTLQFSGPGVDAALTIDGLQAGEVRHVDVHVSGQNADLQTGQDPVDGSTEVEGLITAIDALGLTITVNNQVINVPVGTPITHGCVDFLFTDLVVGDRVHVKGTASGGVITATQVMLQNGQATHGVDNSCTGSNEVELNGVVTGLAGTCPSLTFSLQADTTIIETDASTQFKDAPCDQVADGDTVEVNGTTQTDGTVLATLVDVSDGGANNQNDSKDGPGPGNGHGHNGGN